MAVAGGGGGDTSHPVFVPLDIGALRPLGQTEQSLLVGSYWETVNSGEGGHPLLLDAIEVVGGDPAGPVLLASQLVELLQELPVYSHLPRPSHGVDRVVLASRELLTLRVEAAATSEEESVLVLDCVESKDWFVRSSEADAGVAAPALGMLALTVTLRNDHPGPGLWFYYLGLEFISLAGGRFGWSQR